MRNRSLASSYMDTKSQYFQDSSDGSLVKLLVEFKSQMEGMNRRWIRNDKEANNCQWWPTITTRSIMTKTETFST